MYDYIYHESLKRAKHKVWIFSDLQQENPRNAKECLNDPDSVFYHYKKLVQLRKEKKVMVYGNFKMLYREHPKVPSRCKIRQ